MDIKRIIIVIAGLLLLTVGIRAQDAPPLTYPLVDTNQTQCFSADSVITCGESFDGQDAQYTGLQPNYQDNGDGTITDLNTGLMWISDPGEKTSYAEALQTLETYTFAGYDDWRLPTIKELYSLTDFSGVDPSGVQDSSNATLIPFINNDVFVFNYGDESAGARLIDSQWLTSTVYNSTVMGGEQCFFGFNFADGRIKCYPLTVRQGGNGGYFALFVRGDMGYGQNDFMDNGDGTVTDRATGLTWTQNDNGTGVMWGDALNYCESLSLGGFDDWRLPNIKALQSIVDYDRSPDITDSPAIDPIFDTTGIINEAGQPDHPFFWSSTTHIGTMNAAANAAYIAFGRALGNIDQFGGWLDVHGAGAQRSDPKMGNPADYPSAHGPQGDVRRLLNYVRCVRGGMADAATGDAPSQGGQPDVQPGTGERQGPDLAAAAQQLGISEQALREALGPPPDLQAAAQRLGISVEALEDALGISR